MAYGFKTDAFKRLDSAMRDYPDGIPKNPEVLREVSLLYIEAATALFELMLMIMQARLEASSRGERYRPGEVPMAAA